MIDLNIRALTDLTLRFLPGMIRPPRAASSIVASVAGFMPGPGMAVYFATKAFVLSFTDALAEEFSGTGVHVMSLCPGPVETGFPGAGRHAAGARLPSRVKPMCRRGCGAGWAGFKARRAHGGPGNCQQARRLWRRVSAPRRLSCRSLGGRWASAKA